MDQLALSLEYNSKIAVGGIFHDKINSGVNLKRKFTQIW